MGFCGQCGVKLPDDARFCGDCGATLGGATPAAAAADKDAARAATRRGNWRAVWITLFVVLALIGGCLAVVAVAARRHGISAELARPDKGRPPTAAPTAPPPAPAPTMPAPAPIMPPPSPASVPVASAPSPVNHVEPPLVIPAPQPPPLPPATNLPPELAEANRLYAAGRYAEALPLLDRFMQAHPDSQPAQFRRGMVRIWMNDLDGARKDFTVLAGRDPGDVESRRLLAAVELVGGDCQVARDHVEALAAAHPGDPKITLVRAQAALYNKDTEAARRLFAEARQLKPNLATNLLAEAVHFAKAGATRMALLEFHSVVWLDPTEHRARYDAALAYEQLGRRDQAIQAFEDYLHYVPNGEWADIARRRLQHLRPPAP